MFQIKNEKYLLNRCGKINVNFYGYFCIIHVIITRIIKDNIFFIACLVRTNVFIITIKYKFVFPTYNVKNILLKYRKINYKYNKLDLSERNKKAKLILHFYKIHKYYIFLLSYTKLLFDINHHYQA